MLFLPYSFNYNLIVYIFSHFKESDVLGENNNEESDLDDLNTSNPDLRVRYSSIKQHFPKNISLVEKKS